jgi:cell division control protein 45
MLTHQDGLLAARILASLFRQDDVSYKLVPVGSYTELQVKRDEAFASDEAGLNILPLDLGNMPIGYVAWPG